MIDGIPQASSNADSVSGVHSQRRYVEHPLDIDWRIMQIVNMSIPTRQLFACFADNVAGI